jgi:hypothetical protein
VNSFVIDQPAKEPVPFGSKPLGPQCEAALGAVDHSLLRSHFVIGPGWRRLDIDGYAQKWVDLTAAAIHVDAGQ